MSILEGVVGQDAQPGQREPVASIPFQNRQSRGYGDQGSAVNNIKLAIRKRPYRVGGLPAEVGQDGARIADSILNSFREAAVCYNVAMVCCNAAIASAVFTSAFFRLSTAVGAA